MRANPGGEIDPAEVLGRDKLIAQIWRVLERQSLELTAERRIGKSSVIKKMTAEPATGFVAIYQDLEGIRFPLEFVEAVYADVEAFLSRRKKRAVRLQKLVTSLGGTEFRGLKLPKFLAADWKRLLVAVVEDLEDNLERTLVFFWDEMPFMLQNIGVRGGKAMAREVLDVLRGIRQTCKRIRMVYTGSIGLHHVLGALREEGGVSHAPMNDMDRIDVPPLTPEDATDLAKRIMEGEGLSLSLSAGELQATASGGESLAAELSSQDLGTAAAAALAQEVDCIPYYVHLVVDGLVKSGGVATSESVKAFIRKCIQDPTDPWNLKHYRLRMSPYYGDGQVLAQVLLDALAARGAHAGRSELIRIAKTETGQGDPHQITEMLARLEQDHYLARNRRDEYGFCYSIVERWWKHHRISSLR